MKKPLHLILDRDGVINEDSDNYIRSPEEWIPIPGALEAISALTKAGYIISVATNQSGIGREYYSLETLAAIHEKMHRLVEGAGGKIDQVVFCSHLPTDNCRCRKPLPGLLEQLSRDYNVPLQHTPLIGDSLRDLQAAQSVGCHPILVLTGKGRKTLEKNALLGVPVYDDLAQATRALLAD
ncbi:MAG: D-glycero-beta-D-manno-heptose-1,7-bisphosphate 7-phosphatase [Legionellales bacterium]|nr:D-glycero-beta-D-manno-heptose-1,7-bisphosphate 7-phosphatase [Legionellales bacterium]|tara:strand:+ start:1595 stop:2137 length:543 start_codon:yes stop_codon:yes gene_type:complete